jgi:hypothetical protein
VRRQEAGDLRQAESRAPEMRLCGKAPFRICAGTGRSPPRRPHRRSSSPRRRCVGRAEGGFHRARRWRRRCARRVRDVEVPEPAAVVERAESIHQRVDKALGGDQAIEPEEFRQEILATLLGHQGDSRLVGHGMRSPGRAGQGRTARELSLPVRLALPRPHSSSQGSPGDAAPGGSAGPLSLSACFEA